MRPAAKQLQFMGAPYPAHPTLGMSVHAGWLRASGAPDTR